MSATAKLLVGLGAGLAIGLAIALTGSRAGLAAAAAIEPVGTLWINAIRMTVVPLVVATLVVGIASTDTAAIGRIGGRALVLFLIMLGAGALLAALAAQAWFAGLTIDPLAAQRLQGGVAESAARAAENARQIPTLRQWLIDLVPVNPVRAAADSAMLPLIVFTLLLGIALTRLAPAVRAPVVAVFQGISEAMLLVVRWVLVVAPIGVFALAVPLAARLGLDAAVAIGMYVVAVAVLCAIAIAACYPLVRMTTGIPVALFARALLPAQSIGFSARSSLAALPTMIERAETVLALPPALRTFLLPLAASVFRYGSAVFFPVAVLFVARLYDVPVGAATLATIVVTSVLTTFSIPGVPSGSIVAIVPILLAAGIPVEGIGVLLAVDVIPDAFRTTGNVTGSFTVATMLARSASPAPP